MFLPRPDHRDQEFHDYSAELNDPTGLPLNPVRTNVYWNRLPVIEDVYAVIENIENFAPGIAHLFMQSDNFELEVQPWPYKPLHIASRPTGDDAWAQRFGFSRFVTLHLEHEEKILFLKMGDNGYPVNSFNGKDTSPVVERHGSVFHVHASSKNDAHLVSTVLTPLLRSSYLFPVESLRDIKGRSVLELGTNVQLPLDKA